MSNKKIKNKKGGFTLIETVIVLGVITIAAGTLMFVDLTSYNASQFQSATNNLISVLQTARASSLNNVDQSAHGVAIFPIDHPTSYVIFEGSSYSARYAPKDEIIDSGYAVDLGNGSLKEIVFDQLSGDVDANGSIVLIDHVRKLSFTISVNYEGRISW
ncbi:MAG: type II secretion system protein [Patescibacteria group bacterium]